MGAIGFVLCLVLDGIIPAGIGGALARKLKWGVPRTLTHPDGSVTVPGSVQGFSAPSRAGENGWMGGRLTVSADTITLTLDREGKLSRRVIPRLGASVELRGGPARGLPHVMGTRAGHVALPDGRKFRAAIDAYHQDALALLEPSAEGRQDAAG